MLLVPANGCAFAKESTMVVSFARSEFIAFWLAVCAWKRAVSAESCAAKAEAVTAEAVTESELDLAEGAEAASVACEAEASA